MHMKTNVLVAHWDPLKNLLKSFSVIIKSTHCLLLCSCLAVHPAFSMAVRSTVSRRVPEACYRVHTLEWVCVWGQGLSHVTENGLRAFQRSKMSAQDTLLNTICCIFFQKSN